MAAELRVRLRRRDREISPCRERQRTEWLLRQGDADRAEAAKAAALRRN